MDRLCDAINRIDLRGKRNMISSIIAGILVINLWDEWFISLAVECESLTSVCLLFKFSSGWWIAIDAACAYPSNDDLLKASHVCGALATVAFIMWIFFFACWSWQTARLKFIIFFKGLIQWLIIKSEESLCLMTDALELSQLEYGSSLLF